MAPERLTQEIRTQVIGMNEQHSVSIINAERKIHPVGSLFPDMTGEAFAGLVASIRANGLLEPILLHPDGSIIDGKNRYRACLEADVEPRFTTWDGKGSLVALVTGLNLRRKHLDKNQVAALAFEVTRRFA